MKIKNILLIFILVLCALFIIEPVIQSHPTNNPVNNIVSISNQTTDNQNVSRVNQNLNKENNTPANLSATNTNDSKTNQTLNSQETGNITPANETSEKDSREVDVLSIIESFIPLQSINDSLNNISSTINQILNNQSTENETTKNTRDQENKTPTLTPDDPATKTEFDRIATTPYDEENYNCLHKSRDFQNYLIQHGATDTYVVRIKHNSGSYMHMFVVWNGQAYDPTNQPPYYRVDYDKYIEALNRQGFTTIISQK